jgi:hypothetical protein
MIRDGVGNGIDTESMRAFVVTTTSLVDDHETNGHPGVDVGPPKAKVYDTVAPLQASDALLCSSLLCSDESRAPVARVAATRIPNCERTDQLLPVRRDPQCTRPFISYRSSCRRNFIVLS